MALGATAVSAVRVPAVFDLQSRARNAVSSRRFGFARLTEPWHPFASPRLPYSPDCQDATRLLLGSPARPLYLRRAHSSQYRATFHSTQRQTTLDRVGRPP